jgi:hypothetical protein
LGEVRCWLGVGCKCGVKDGVEMFGCLDVTLFAAS